MTPVSNQQSIVKEDGALMLYILTSIVACKTRTTILSLLKQLNNITWSQSWRKSSQTFRSLTKRINMVLVGLQARRATVPDILPNLFEAYKNCGDLHFVNYIIRKEEEYEDSTLVDFTRDKLMKMVQERFKSRNEKNVWMQKSEQELEFMAVKAELDDAMKKHLTQRKTPGTGTTTYDSKP